MRPASAYSSTEGLYSGLAGNWDGKPAKGGGMEWIQKYVGADITSKGGHYLLNIEPTGDGSIPQPSIDIMTATGKWMGTNAKVYGLWVASAQKIKFPDVRSGHCGPYGRHVLV